MKAQSLVRLRSHVENARGMFCAMASTGERDMDNNHGTWFDGMWQGVALYVDNVTQATQAANECAKVRAHNVHPLKTN